MNSPPNAVTVDTRLLALAGAQADDFYGTIRDVGATRTGETAETSDAIPGLAQRKRTNQPSREQTPEKLFCLFRL